MPRESGCEREVLLDGKTIMEKEFGKGRVIVCTFQTGGAITGDPVSRDLSVSLLRLSKG